MSDATRDFRDATPPLGPPPGDRPASPTPPQPRDPRESGRPAAGDVLVGDYEHVLLRPLGKGGFGEVWLAETRTRPGPGQPAATVAHTAVKFFLADHPEQIDFMARRELLGLKALDDPHVVRVVDYSLERRGTFIALEYHPAGSVLQQPALRPPLPHQALAALARDVLRGLVAAHRASILHLDLKPHNILVGADGRFLLADFGISQGSLVPWRVARPAGGTPGFRAPEQARLIEAKVEPRTDLWGVGATLWSLATGVDLAGKEPFPGIDWDRDRFGLPSLSTYRPTFPPAVEAVIMQCVATRIEDRPGSAAHALAAFESALLGGREALAVHLPAEGRLVADPEAVAALGRQLLDPTCVELLRTFASERRLYLFPPGATLLAEGESSHHAFFLLKGRVDIFAGAQRIATEGREGLFLGEVAALLGTRRTAGVRAERECWAVLLHASELERVFGQMPSLALRMARSLAERLARTSAPAADAPAADREVGVAERVQRTARRGGPTDPAGSITPAVSRLWQATHSLGLWSDALAADVQPPRSFAAWHEGLFTVAQASECYLQPRLWGARSKPFLAREAASFATSSEELLATLVALAFLREKLGGQAAGGLDAVAGMHTEGFRIGLLFGAGLAVGVVLVQRFAFASRFAPAEVAAALAAPAGAGPSLPLLALALALLAVAALLFSHAVAALTRRRLVLRGEATFYELLQATPEPGAAAAQRAAGTERLLGLGLVAAFALLSLAVLALWLRADPWWVTALAVSGVCLLASLLLAIAAPSAATLRRTWREAVARVQAAREQRRRRG